MPELNVRPVEFVAGLLIVAVVLFDIFAAVVLPRPAQTRVRPSARLIRGSWSVWRKLALRLTNAEEREDLLGAYAPLTVLVVFAFWVASLILGYGLILHALRDQLHPRTADLGSALYFAATSFLTIGYGDIVAQGLAARLFALAAGATGLATVAIVLTFLFTLFSSFQRREVFVVTLSARAGAPPSGVALLETHAHLDLTRELPESFARGQSWCAEVLQDHLAYPILAYFRSAHENESWIGALGAVLDAATLLVTTIEGVPSGQAQLLLEVGTHLTGDLSRYFGFADDGEIGIDRPEFEQARERLGACGYRLREADAAWQAFSRLRSRYASALNAMAVNWAIPPAQWIGDRSLLHHRPR